MVRNLLGDNCGYCGACVRARLSAARGRSPEPSVCAYRHILESYGPGAKPGQLPQSPRSACASCRWTSNAQFPESPPQSSSDLSLEWSSQSSRSSRSRRRKR